MTQNPDRKRQTENLQDIEQMIARMSLKSPPDSLDWKIRTPARSARMNPRRSRAWTLAVAVSSLFAGIVLGRMDLDSLVQVVSKPAVAPRAAPRPTVSGMDARLAAETRLPKNPGMRVLDEGIFLLNGKIPVRKYVAVSNQRVRLFEPGSGKPVEMILPVRKSFVAPAPGT